MYSVSLPDYCDEYIRKLTLLIFSFVNIRIDLDTIPRTEFSTFIWLGITLENLLFKFSKCVL